MAPPLAVLLTLILLFLNNELLLRNKVPKLAKPPPHDSLMLVAILSTILQLLIVRTPSL